MRALVIAGVVLVAVTAYADYPRFMSPDRKFEAYTAPNAAEGAGSKLFLRRANSSDQGILVFENMRWLDAKWSPNSRFLAVVDHNDGHIADVYVFGVSGNQPQITLYFHTPEPRTYDVQWNVVGWHLKTRSIVLKKEVRDQHKEAREHTPGYAITQSKIVAQIGDTPLPLP
jgi:hypothetical protein